MIPARLIRTAPVITTGEQDRLWAMATGLHPDWEHVDLRNDCDPEPFPLTRSYWSACETGAQWADLVRFEELWHRGGVYIDSDVECYKPFDPLMGLPAFAGYETPQNVCIAVLGFPAQHPTMERAVELAIERRHLGTREAGMGTFQLVLGLYPHDVVLFPPAMFYPYLWTQQCPSDLQDNNPWSFTVHHWAKSWQK